MRVACLGGGPAGLYFAITMKLRDPTHEVVVIERNRPYDTFGWGVVLSDETLANLRAADAVSAEVIRRAFVYWDDIAVFHRGTVTRSSGHGFSGIGRKRLLNILQDRAQALGVELKFET
ncbi:MAG TPA: bifunctional salicylyl-CoA 5-hydroxylase/oxidoreductase, partial [Hyphomicrobiaceae bacterium]|nr:bifunctional salicylyl-CoA 5-hydroxylase/oxidoreductase [Hyphomicrobiaceae bacterium]